MRYSILGPLDISDGNGPIEINRPFYRTLAATLLLDPNRVVPVTRLIDSIWDETPPATARDQIYKGVSGLRRLLERPRAQAAARQQAERPVIDRRAPGYAIVVGPHELDTDIMQHHVTQARAALDARRPAKAARSLREALGLWRGFTLDGLTTSSGIIRAVAAGLDERRMTIYEECIDLELGLGRHHELIGELISLTENHPAREGLVGRLMLALYRAGRRAEALRTYSRTRERFIGELGLEPSEALRKLQHAILADEPVLAAGTAVPAEQSERVRPTTTLRLLLPPLADDVPVHTPHLDSLVRHIEDRPADGGHCAVAVITGRLGMGKTTLAVRSAHRLLPRFPDGAVYIDLEASRARYGEPPRLDELLSRLLRALEVETGPSFAEQTEAYRLTTASRRILFVLDDAPSGADLRPLLPAGFGSAMLVTSRGELPELKRAAGRAGRAGRVELLPLDHADAGRLLCTLADRRIPTAGRDRTALDRILEKCGGLPLAIHGCAMHLASRRHWEFAALDARLADLDQRLDLLSWGPYGLREVLASAFQTVDSDAQALFEQLASVEGNAPTGPEDAARLCGASIPRARQLFDQLIDAQLVDVVIREYDGREMAFALWQPAVLYARERLAAKNSQISGRC